MLALFSGVYGMLRFYAFERVEILSKKLNENAHPKLINITVDLLPDQG